MPELHLSWTRASSVSSIVTVMVIRTEAGSTDTVTCNTGSVGRGGVKFRVKVKGRAVWHFPHTLVSAPLQ
jgi:hypothetical protein